MKTKRSTLIGLLSTLLVIVTVLSSVLVFTATADSTEPETEANADFLVYASSKDELLEKNPLQPWTLSGDTWQETTTTGAGNVGEYAWIFIDMTVVGDYDLVAFGINGETSSNLLEYAFLEKLPTEAGEKADYAGSGYYKYSSSATNTKNGKLNGFLWYDDIPEGTKYLGICATNYGTRVTPIKLIFNRTDKNLKDNSLASYDYPMSSVVSSMLGVNDSGAYYLMADKGNVSGNTVAIIPLEDTVFDSVVFTAGYGTTTVDYAFVTEMPGNWDTIQTADGTNNLQTADDGEEIAIPDGAKYLFIRHSHKKSPVIPVAITFLNSDAVVTEDWLGIPAASTTKTVAYTGLEENGCIYGWDSDSNSHKWLEEYTKDHHSGFIDLTDRNYTKVSFTVGSEGYLGIGFLNETPVLGEMVSYSSGAKKFYEPDCDAGDVVEVDIPNDATTIVVWMREGSTSYVPSSISLTYEEKAAAPYGIELGAVAEARLNANSGLRFTTRIPTAELAGLDYTVGTLIFPTDALDGALTVDTVGALNIEMTRGVAGNEYTYFTAAMTSIIAQNYAREFTAVSYIEVGGEYYYTAATSSSIYEAAVETYKANAEDENADAVRAYIDSVVVIEDGEQVMPYDGYDHALTATITDGTLTITGDAALATVIIDGVIYTGGWTTTADGYTATID